MPFQRLKVGGAQVIDLSRGEQIVIQQGARHTWHFIDSPNRLAGLNLEPRRDCNLFFEENGVWYCGKYRGGVDEVPRLVTQDLATEKERREREEAKWLWHQQHTGHANGIGGFRPTPWGRDSPTASFPTTAGHTVTSPAVAFGPSFPHGSPSINTQHNFWEPSSPGGFVTPGNFPSSNYSINSHMQAPPMQMSNTHAFSPQVFPSSSAFPISSPMPHGSGRGRIIDGGDYTCVGGRVTHENWNNSFNMFGTGNRVTCDSDVHEELNGTYSVNWPR